MESKAKLLGHPIHPMLIVFPLGLFVSAVVFDILYLVFLNQLFTVVSFYNIAGGVIGGLLAAVFGFRDWAAIPNDTRAKSIGLYHGMGNLLVVILFSWSLIMRQPAPGYVPTVMAMIPSFLALAIATVTGWLGGELVDRLGIGVDPGAHMNAPSSLSDQPASVGAQSFVPVTGEELEKDEP
jgi:uncharacterized membrane protein